MSKVHCNELLGRVPDNMEALELLGQIEIASNAPIDAIRHFEHALRLDPSRGGNWRFLAQAHQLTGDRQHSLRALERACQVSPQDIDAWRSLSGLLVDAGLLAEAENSMMQCVAANVENGDAVTGLGVVRLKRADWEGAKSAFADALAIEPESIPPAKHLAFLLEISGDVEGSAHLLDRAISFGGGDTVVFVQAARVARRRGNATQAIEYAMKALEMDNACADAHYQLGCALWDRGDTSGASRSFRATFELDPNNACARWAFAMAGLPSSRVADGESLALSFGSELAALEQWLTTERAQGAVDAVGSFTPFFLAYVERNNLELLSRYGDLCARVMDAHCGSGGERSKVAREAKSRRPIRVGIVSAHLHDHSVWHAILKGWFLHLDKSTIKLYAYSLKSLVDAETSIAMANAGKFVQLGSRDHDRWANAIAEDNLDVLIYPEIGMNGIALQLACRRLAPIQAAAWGHPETTGLPQIDYFLSGADFEPPNGAEYYREKLITLANIGVCYVPPSVPVVEVDFANLGLSPQRPIVLCPGSAFKYSPEHDDLFVDIAKSAPTCQMVLFGEAGDEMAAQLRGRLKMAFKNAGLEIDGHVVAIPWLDQSRWRGLLAQSTVLLDTIGFSGFNTAAQALAADVPVVAWNGKFLRGRLASGLLRRMDLHEWIADSHEGFVALVARLCHDSDVREQVVAKIAAAKSRIFDDREPIRGLENFLLEQSDILK